MDMLHLVLGFLSLASLTGLAVFGANIMATDDNIKYLIALNILDAAGGMKAQVTQAKTASYQIVTGVDPSDSTFTNRGAVGAVVFTLPVAAPALKGTRYKFVGVADQTFTVASAAGAVVAFNNAAATSLACSTGGQKIGAVILAECDGTSWILSGISIGVTYTVA